MLSAIVNRLQAPSVTKDSILPKLQARACFRRPRRTASCTALIRPTMKPSRVNNPQSKGRLKTSFQTTFYCSIPTPPSFTADSPCSRYGNPAIYRHLSLSNNCFSLSLLFKPHFPCRCHCARHRNAQRHQQGGGGVGEFEDEDYGGQGHFETPKSRRADDGGTFRRHSGKKVFHAAAAAKAMVLPSIMDGVISPPYAPAAVRAGRRTI